MHNSYIRPCWCYIVLFHIFIQNNVRFFLCRTKRARRCHFWLLLDRKNICHNLGNLFLSSVYVISFHPGGQTDEDSGNTAKIAVNVVIQPSGFFKDCRYSSLVISFLSNTTPPNLFKKFSNFRPTQVISPEDIYQTLRSFLRSLKRLYTIFFIYAVILAKTCKQTCKIWWRLLLETIKENNKANKQ